MKKSAQEDLRPGITSREYIKRLSLLMMPEKLRSRILLAFASGKDSGGGGGGGGYGTTENWLRANRDVSGGFIRELSGSSRFSAGQRRRIVDEATKGELYAPIAKPLLLHTGPFGRFLTGRVVENKLNGGGDSGSGVYSAFSRNMRYKSASACGDARKKLPRVSIPDRIRNMSGVSCAYSSIGSGVLRDFRGRFSQKSDKNVTGWSPAL